MEMEMLTVLQFLSESSPFLTVIAVVVVFYILNLKINNLKDGQRDLEEDIKEIRGVLFTNKTTIVKTVSEDEN